VITEKPLKKQPPQASEVGDRPTHIASVEAVEETRKSSDEFTTRA
jgi:hypothetical protein